ncbi:MAG: transketolase [Syntrophorhabdales bacterium]|jgi:transketolase
MDRQTVEYLENLAKLIRYYILVSTTNAGSGHPTSSLSAADLMTGLMFGGFFLYDPARPTLPNNDRFVLSKGHASPLLYALWTVAGQVTEEELMEYRVFGSPLEGHPTPHFRFVEAATGSLGQGLSIGVGMALNGQYLDRLPYRTYVLLGDSEMAEGSNWEALAVASHYKLGNLVGIIDVNRLGQRGETMYGWDVESYEKRVSAFGWDTIVIDGHNFDEIIPAFKKTLEAREKPVMIIARTIKGKGVPAVENKNGWHGKVLKEEDVREAVMLMEPLDRSIRGKMAGPPSLSPQRQSARSVPGPSYKQGEAVATRMAYGNALKRLYPAFPDMVVLDGEVNNSTYADIFKEAFPERYFEMYIAEQNMVGAAMGLYARGKLPFVSTFAAFFTRAFDQIRMSRYSDAKITFTGSHAGVSIGEDGPSQMGLEDIAMFRNITGSVVLYPADAVSTEKLVELAAGYGGIVYLRTTRGATPVIYDPSETFEIGGFKVLKRSDGDRIAVVAAGITLFEALGAHEELKKEGIACTVIDLYCIKPLDGKMLKEAVGGVSAVVTVEDHHPEGGMGEAMRSALADSPIPVHSLAVRKVPRSGKPAQLIEYEEISQAAIIKKVKELI